MSDIMSMLSHLVREAERVETQRAATYRGQANDLGRTVQLHTERLSQHHQAQVRTFELFMKQNDEYQAAIIAANEAVLDIMASMEASAISIQPVLELTTNPMAAITDERPADPARIHQIGEAEGRRGQRKAAAG